jgi:hypothetical protein
VPIIARTIGRDGPGAEMRPGSPALVSQAGSGSGRETFHSPPIKYAMVNDLRPNGACQVDPERPGWFG